MKQTGGAKAAEKPYLFGEPAQLRGLGAMVLRSGQLEIETRLRLMHSFPDRTQHTQHRDRKSGCFSVENSAAAGERIVSCSH